MYLSVGIRVHKGVLKSLEICGQIQRLEIHEFYKKVMNFIVVNKIMFYSTVVTSSSCRLMAVGQKSWRSVIVGIGKVNA